MTRQETVDALKSAALNIGATGVLAWLVTVAPWTRWPVISSAVKWLVRYILDVAIDKTEMAVFFLYIDVRTSVQGRAFAEAARVNRLAQLSGTPEDKAKAEQELIHAFRAFVKVTN